MPAGDTALLLIDIQNDYFAGGAFPLVGSEKAVIRARELLLFFRSHSWPVFHIQHLSIRPGSTFFLPDTPGAAIHADLQPLHGEDLIVKHHPNSFRETRLLKVLREKGISDLVVCGMMTHMCLDATVRAAKDLGFTLRVVEDACATRDLSFHGSSLPADLVHHAFLSALEGYYARIVTAVDFIRMNS